MKELLTYQGRYLVTSKVLSTDNTRKTNDNPGVKENSYEVEWPERKTETEINGYRN